MNRLEVSKEFADSFFEKINKGEYTPPISFIYNNLAVDNTGHNLTTKQFDSLGEATQWLENLHPSRLYESRNNFPKLREWMTLQNLMDLDAVSTVTQKHAKIRNSLYKGENINAKLVKTIYDPKNDTMTYCFSTPATLRAHEPGYEPLAVDPHDSFKKKSNPSAQYTMMIQVLDFLKWLKETRPSNSGRITWREIKDVLDVAYVKLWCPCSSFHWQGKNYRISRLDASIYPTDIPDKKMRKVYGEYDLLCKHLSNLVKPNSIQFFLPQMASAAQKVLRQSNLV